MKTNSATLLNQNGSILTIALLVMAALTILGIASINTAMVELHISRNEHQLRESFYLSEGAAVEGIQRLAVTPAMDLDEQHLPWHHSRDALAAEKIDFRNPEHWDVDHAGRDNGLQSALDPRAYLAAVEWTTATGASLISTQTRLYVNRVYGLCTKNQADTIVEIGYKMRY
jgi:PilX N-terminal